MEGPLRSVVEALGARWELQVSDEMAKKVVVADARLLAQALEAVLVNACEAYEEPGRERVVRLRAEEPFCEVWVCNLAVEDSGIGVRPQIQSLVFDPFFTTKTGHLGMGLTFARRIIEEQAGEIVVQSRLGQGTQVSLCLAGEWRRPLRTRPLGGTP